METKSRQQRSRTPDDDHLKQHGHSRLRSRIARAGVLMLTALLALGGLTIGTSAPAHAGSIGIGFSDGKGGYLGSFNTDVAGVYGYCMDLDADPPFNTTSGPQTVTTLDSLSPGQLAQLNYVLGTWGQSTDPLITAATAAFVWWMADSARYTAQGGDGHFLSIVPAAQRPAVADNLAIMRKAATANAVANPWVTLSVAMADQYQGTLTVAASPASLSGTVTLTDARFADGKTSKVLSPGSYAITGRPADGVPSYTVQASMRADGLGLGAKVDLYTTPGAQRLLAAGSLTALDASATSPVIALDFQPTIRTEVSSKFVQVGDSFVDALSVGVSKGTWIQLGGKPIPITAKGTLYGPFDEQPAEADTPPAGAQVRGTEEVVLTGAGDYQSAGSVAATESGFYTWVWDIDKEAQGTHAKYLTASFRDRFGLVPETSVTPFQPVAISTVDAHLADPGDEITDTITVSSDNGAWLKRDGQFIPVVFEGTAYQVSGTLPPGEDPAVPKGATPIGTVTVTATGPGVYTSPALTHPNAGFVTWVWSVSTSAQPDGIRDFIASDWADNYGIPKETVSVRHPLTITSEVREFNVHSGGRAFDEITVSGFPENHGDFGGDGYWEADNDTIVHTVYGPITNESDLTDDLDLTGIPVLTEVVTPAKNGVYKIGYTDDDRIVPTKAGYYVVVSTFDGDDRVQPFTSSPADILERFYVPSAGKIPISVITQAAATIGVNQPFSDKALVQGTDLPAGAYLEFRAYGPFPTDASPDCSGTPFYTSLPVAVTQPGVYDSGSTTVTRPGNVYWVETLFDRDGTRLAQGECGAPGETTIVTETPAPEPTHVPTDTEAALAHTGADTWMLPVGIAAALSLAVGTALLIRSRRKGAPGTDTATPIE